MLNLYYCLIISLNCIFKFVELFKIGYEITKICVSQEIPGDSIFWIEKNGALDDLKGFLDIESFLVLVFLIKD